LFLQRQKARRDTGPHSLVSGCGRSSRRRRRAQSRRGWPKE
jgi:hypothetical protein